MTHKEYYEELEEEARTIFERSPRVTEVVIGGYVFDREAVEKSVPRVHREAVEK